jgi:hypothetical protein
MRADVVIDRLGVLMTDRHGGVMLAGDAAGFSARSDASLRPPTAPPRRLVRERY